MRLGFLGPRGTFTEEAALLYLRSGQAPAPSPALIPYPAIDELLYDVDRRVLDEGVVPAENSIEGTVAVTLDLLVHEVNLQICAEVVLPVRHNLLAPAGLVLSDVQLIVSHPQALAQCRRTLRQLLPAAQVRQARSTAEAAQWVAQSGAGAGAAAIGTTLAAELYGLEILRSDLQDVEENATRFLVVGHRCCPPTGKDKTSVVFSFPTDRPGDLYRALGEFASRNINLTKLESRPAKRVLGEYLFFLDLEGHHQEPLVAEALAAVRGQSAFFKLLGSYPRTEYRRRPTGGL